MLQLKLQYFGHLMRRVNSLERPWCWQGLGAEGEGDDSGWNGWKASPTRWTRVWVNSGSWWRTGRPGVLWFMGSQRVGHDWVTELNWNIASLHLWAESMVRNNFTFFIYSHVGLSSHILPTLNYYWIFTTVHRSASFDHSIDESSKFAFVLLLERLYVSSLYM